VGNLFCADYIKINYRKKAYGYLALIDSGADTCVFHGKIAKALDVPIEKGKTAPLYGVTKGKGFVYYHNVVLEMGGWKVKSYVGFSYDLKYPLGILGQTGFFEFFNIVFDFKKKIIDVRPKYIQQ